jgi:hypothetical protein
MAEVGGQDVWGHTEAHAIRRAGVCQAIELYRALPVVTYIGTEYCVVCR